MNPFKTILDLPETIFNIARDLASLTSYVERVINRPPPTPPPVTHFVCVYIEAMIREQVNQLPPLRPPDTQFSPDSEYGWEGTNPPAPMHLSAQPIYKVRRGSMADSAFITDRHLFRIQPHQTVKDLRITIFCDMSKVTVEMAKCANQDLSFYNENALISYFDGVVTPANAITIAVKVR